MDLKPPDDPLNLNRSAMLEGHLVSSPICSPQQALFNQDLPAPKFVDRLSFFFQEYS